MTVTTRADLIDQVRTVLGKAGFAVSERCDVRPVSFDVMARRDDTLLVIKILANVDALGERVAQELRVLARFLKGVPLLVGERSSAGPLEPGVLYSHRGIAIVSQETLTDFLLENQPPLAYAAPGGLHVRLRGEVLRQLRQERRLSLGLLAEVAGVSRRAVQMYEEGMRATVESALRLEEFLQTSLIEAADPFKSFAESQPEGDLSSELSSRLAGLLERDIFQILRTVGFRVVPTAQSPFNAVTQEKETILTGVDRGDPTLARRAQIISSVTAVAEKDSMIVVRKERRVDQISGTPLVQANELERLRDPAELIDLLDHRRKKPRPP